MGLPHFQRPAFRPVSAGHIRRRRGGSAPQCSMLRCRAAIVSLAARLLAPALARLRLHLKPRLPCNTSASWSSRPVSRRVGSNNSSKPTPLRGAA